MYRKNYDRITRPNSDAQHQSLAEDASLLIFLKHKFLDHVFDFMNKESDLLSIFCIDVMKLKYKGRKHFISCSNSNMNFNKK